MHAVPWGSFHSRLWVTTLCAFASVSISLHAVMLEYARGQSRREGRNRASTAQLSVRVGVRRRAPPGPGGGGGDGGAPAPPPPPRPPRLPALRQLPLRAL